MEEKIMSNSVTEFERNYSDLNIKDKDDPKSVVNLCPSVVAEKIMAIPDDIFLLGEEDLKKAANAQPSEESLRVAFWEEYKRAERTGSRMNMTNVYAGFVTKRYFQTFVVGNSYKLAYMLMPPMEIQIALEEIVLLGLKRQKEWLSQPLIDSKGNLNVKLGLVQQKITEDALNRRRGHVLRQTEVTTRNTNLNLEIKTEAPKTLADIEREIQELEQPAQLEHSNQPSIAVTYKDVSNEKQEV